MRFSVIIQSFLGAYVGAAKDRESKILRAIDSVLNQTFKDFEIIVVADGCEKTFDIISANYGDRENIDCVLIKKQPLWSGRARNFGIQKAKGEYIAYLDIDDKWGENHLRKIDEQVSTFDWVWFNDSIIRNNGNIEERTALITQKFQCGTSNVCHKKELQVGWNGGAYGMDDWSAVSCLLKYPNYAKIKTPEYFCCHIPHKLDV